jgi:hypothetical protein
MNCWVQYGVEIGSIYVFCGIFYSPNLVTCGISATYKSKHLTVEAHALRG